MNKVFFTNKQACWICEIVSKDQMGISLKMYGKTTYFPWHQIDRIE